MNQYFNFKVAKKSAKMITVAYLLVHLWLTYYFYALGVTLMFYFNIASVIMYLIGYFWLDRGKLNVFVYASELEMTLHVVLATICVGSMCGFQWILPFMQIEFYYVEFFSLEVRGKKAHATLSSIMNILVFFWLEYYVRMHPPLYEIPQDVAFYTRMFLVIAIFLVAAFMLRTFTKHAYQMEQKMREKALIDGLTGLYNRFELMDELDNRAQRGLLEGAWIAMVDLDDFRQINQQHGRNIGDQILLQVSDVLRYENQDWVCARWSGDTFVICGFGCKDEQNIIEAMEVLRDKFAQISIGLMEGEIKVHATVGIAFYKKGQGIREWVSTVDKKLYAGKYNGKDCVVS